MKLFGLLSTNHEKECKRDKIHIDEELFIKIADGDMIAFEELYRKTDKAVYGFILSILKNTHDAEDVLQDTYLKIRGAAHLYKPQGKPLAWIFTIAKNLSLMKLRVYHRDGFTSFEELENSLDFSVSTNIEDKLILNAAFSILEEEERKIIVLHAITGLKHREIAEILDMPLSTVLSKYARSLNKLRRHLTEREKNHETNIQS